LTLVVTACVSNSCVNAAISYRLAEGMASPPGEVEVSGKLRGGGAAPPGTLCERSFLWMANGSKIDAPLSEPASKRAGAKEDGGKTGDSGRPIRAGKSGNLGTLACGGNSVERKEIVSKG